MLANFPPASSESGRVTQSESWARLTWQEPRLRILKARVLRATPSAADAAFERHVADSLGRLRVLMQRSRNLMLKSPRWQLLAEQHLVDALELAALRRAFAEGRLRLAREAAGAR